MRFILDEVLSADGELMWRKGEKSILSYHEARELMRGTCTWVRVKGRNYRGPFTTKRSKSA
jgi:hypothetical protein